MKSKEFDIVTASFIPYSIDIDMLEEAIYDFDGRIEIPESSTFFPAIQCLTNDLYIAFFAEVITIFGILTFHINAEHRISVGAVCSPFHVHVPSGKEFSLSFRGKMLKIYFSSSDHIFGENTSPSMMDSFFFRDKKTRCAVFSGWEKEFNSLDELIQFLTGYMLIS